MGRFGASGTPTGVAKPLFRVHYRKLVEDQPNDTISFVPSLPDCVPYYCKHCGHKQNLKAEELNSIVGNAFRLAYAAHLQRQPNLHEVISTQLEDKHLQRANQYSGEQPQTLESQTMDPLTSGGSPTLLVHHKPSSIPGLRAFSHNSQNNNRTDSNQSTPCSEESNSPTELNSYKRLLDKPPLMKRIAMGLNSSAAPDEENCPLVQRNSTNSVEESRPSLHPVIDSDSIKKINLDNRLNQSPGVTTDVDFKLKRMSPISSSGSGSVLNGSDTKIPVPPPPPPPERTDSLCSKIEEELKAAPWFQAGIPREITLEVLGQEPVGSFMVRESTTKPGCFALSLRVPRDFQPLGIAHYLIMRTNKGYKIKGFTKEFTSLTALITHHSVMPELLPCPLSLSRYNPSFTKADTSKDFADIDSDPDYNTLADFRKMMADLNV